MEDTKETKDLDFGDLTLKIAKPKLAKNGVMVINGNFTELAGNIKALVSRYSGTMLTDSNYTYVKRLKGQFVSLRTGIERERKEYKKSFLQPPARLIDSMCDELQKIVAEGEGALVKQLNVYDQKIKDDLTKVLKAYVADAVTKHALRPEYAAQIILQPKYYNTTQREEDSADDIEKQAEALERDQKDRDAAIDLIKAECEGTGFVPDTYIRELDYKPATEIIMEIKSDKQIAEEAKKKEAADTPVVVGSPVAEEVKEVITAKPVKKNAKMRTRTVQITYRRDQGVLLTEFFKVNGIAVKFLS